MSTQAEDNLRYNNLLLEERKFQIEIETASQRKETVKVICALRLEAETADRDAALARKRAAELYKELQERKLDHYITERRRRT